MRVRVLFLVLFAVLLTGCQASESQPADGVSDLSSERILQNLKLQIPQLRQASDLQLGAMSSSTVPSFQRSTLTINGSRQVPVLVRDDGEQLLVLAGEPVDVSKSLDEATAAIDAESKHKKDALSSV